MTASGGLGLEAPVAREPSTQKSANRIAGLDSLRFILATVVLLSHIDFAANVAPDSAFMTTVRALLGNWTPGPPAVIVFFIVSGFCIHFPYRTGTKGLPSLYAFYVRRWVRTLVPLGIALIMAHAIVGNWRALDGIIWSLICEEVYYLLYPLLRRWTPRYSWFQILLVSYIPAVVLFIALPGALHPWQFGSGLTWLAFFPCWLLGCVLAEQVDSLRETRARFCIPLLTWRCVIWVFAAGCSILRFHVGIPYPWTLSAFAVTCFFWLRREMSGTSETRFSSSIEWLGGVSYSIYLTHPPFVILIASFLPSGLLTKFVTLCGSLLLCVLFGVLVEKPIHRLARALSHKMSSKAQPVE